MSADDEIEREAGAGNDGNETDTYGVLAKETEVDSDVNEDRSREWLLDASFLDWYRNIAHVVQQKEDLVQVPGENVFDAAAGVDTGLESEEKDG